MGLTSVGSSMKGDEVEQLIRKILDERLKELEETIADETGRAQDVAKEAKKIAEKALKKVEEAEKKGDDVQNPYIAPSTSWEWHVNQFGDYYS